MKDVSCGLAYLHNFNGQKKAILHGNLQAFVSFIQFLASLDI